MVDDESERGGARWPAPALKTDKKQFSSIYPRISGRPQTPKNIPYDAAEPFPELLCLPVTTPYKQN